MHTRSGLVRNASSGRLKNCSLTTRSFGIAFSVLGLVAGAWLLAIGVEGARGPTEVCGYGEPLCISRPAPYAASVRFDCSHAFISPRLGSHPVR